MHLIRPLAVLSAIAATTIACSGNPATIGEPAGSSSGTSGSGSNGSSGGSSSGGGATSSGGTAASPTVSAEGAALFNTPSSTSATPDTIMGVWGGVMKDLDFTFDTRMRISPSSVTFATRCEHNGTSGAIAGITATARVTDDEFAILESKKDERKLGDITCRANAHVGDVKRCENVDGFQTKCFVLGGTELTFYGDTPFDKLDLTKISD